MMFGWLGKKKAAPSSSAPPASHVRAPEQAPSAAQWIGRTVARWDAVIAGVQGEADALLARTAAQSERILSSTPTDFQPLSRLWTKAEAELRPFHDELSDKWNALSSELSALTVPEATMRYEGNKRDGAWSEITIRCTRAQRRFLARAAEQLARRATESGDATLLALFVGTGATHVAQFAAQDAWEAMQRADRKIAEYRDKKEVPLELLSELEAASRSYYEKLLNVEAEHAPLQRPYVAAKLARYMQDVERKLSQYWQWRGRVR